MRAAICPRYGPPEVVQLTDAPAPTPTPKELLVRVTTSTVNRTTAHIRGAKPAWAIRPAYGLRKPRRPILGTDFAGRIEQVGDEVRGFEAGDRVFGFDDRRMGGHAQLLTIPASAAVTHTPDAVSDRDAAASVEGAHYSLTYLDRAALEPGQRALVYGGGGAIGSTAVQLLVSQGVDVAAVAEEHQRELMHQLGASRVIDYRTEDFTAIGEEFDLVLDAVGKTRFRFCRRLVREGGAFMATELGPLLENVRLTLTTRFSKRRVHFPLPLNPRAHVKVAAEQLAAGSLRPVIDREVALDELVDAYRYVESETKTGVVVLHLP